ncbi:hypothetical protein TNCV_2011541 [Trichonephila clavipes]|nr:hypothetical protein TNCV_2011541 [Trichonephila clavipes]
MFRSGGQSVSHAGQVLVGCSSPVTNRGCNFSPSMNFPSEPATPAHILECLGLTKQDLADDSLLMLDFLKVYDVMDQV